MIVSGKDKPLFGATGGLPDVSDALLDWFQSLTFRRITKTTVNFKVVENKETIYTQGVKQPLSAQALLMKPEGQRGWKWFQLHCLPNVILKLDDFVEFGNDRYRVKGKEDYSEYGYIKYELVQGFNE